MIQIFARLLKIVLLLTESTNLTFQVIIPQYVSSFFLQIIGSSLVSTILISEIVTYIFSQAISQIGQTSSNNLFKYFSVNSTNHFSCKESKLDGL